jgi:hypothetical protein
METTAPFERSWSVRVHLLSDDDRVELRRLGPKLADAYVCSGLFHLPERDGEVTLRVSAGEQGSRILGGVLVVGGSAAFAIGGLSIHNSSSTSARAFSSETSSGWAASATPSDRTGSSSSSAATSVFL